MPCGCLDCVPPNNNASALLQAFFFFFSFLMGSSYHFCETVTNVKQPLNHEQWCENLIILQLDIQCIASTLMFISLFQDTCDRDYLN